MTPPLRVSPDGVVAVRDSRFYGGETMPWSVVYVPAPVRSHWPSQPLSDQEVGTWDVLVAQRSVA